MEPQNLDELRSVEELLAYQKDVKGRAEELHDEYKGLPFPEEAKNEFAGLMKQNQQIESRVKELEARRRMLEHAASNPNATEATSDVFRDPNPNPSLKERDIYNLHTIRANPMDGDAYKAELRDRALRAVELARFPHERAKREDCQTHIERLIENAQESQPGVVAEHILRTGNPVYRRAFGKTLGGAQLSSEEQTAMYLAQRALSLAGAGGGFAIPFALDPSIIPTSNSVVNPTRAISRVEQIAGSNTWQGVSSAGITAARVAEATAATDNAPVLVQPTATVTKAHAFVPFSIEVGQDWGALESEMAKLLQDAKDEEEGTAFVTGSGAGVNPEGFVTGTTNTVAAAAGLTVTAANVYALEAALPPRFRSMHSFVANRGIYNVVRGIDTAGGAALWLYISQGLVTQAPTPGNTGATLLGRGAWEASAMQATVVNATKIMVVGDFRYFLIVDRIGMTVEVIPHLFGAAQGNLPTGQRGIYSYWRNTSKVLSAAAFRALTGTT